MSPDPPSVTSEPDRLAELLRHVRPDPADVVDHDVDGDGLLVSGRHRPGRVPLLTVPESLRSVDLAVGRRAVRGLLVVATVVVLVLGGRWGWAQLAAAPVAAQSVAVGAPGPSPPPAAEGSTTGPAQAPAAGTDPALATADPDGAPPATDSSPAAAATVRLIVHVTGAVGSPGVVEVPSGSRVVDAIEAAGGLLPDADQSTLNLARPVTDGEQVWVGRPGEPPPAAAPVAVGMPNGAGGVRGAGVPGSPGAGPSTAAQLVDLNSADQALLEELPGVGPVTAGHILAWRQANGRFTRVDELLEISGIGERTFARLEPLVTVGS